MNDLRFALRQLWKSPGFACVAIATLALGIGANTAIFSVIESALLRPLPFPNADRLVRLYESFEENGPRSGSLNLAEKTFRDWREHGSDIFEGIGVATGVNVTSAIGDEPARNFPAAEISSDFLNVLGVQPMLGRNFTEAEDKPGGPRVAIVGYDFWQRELGGRADVLGQTITLEHAPYTIIGVMPKTFRHPTAPTFGCPSRCLTTKRRCAIIICMAWPGSGPGSLSNRLRLPAAGCVRRSINPRLTPPTRAASI